MLVLTVISSNSSFAFSDVKKGAYYEDAVKWAVDQKIVFGYPDNTFKPNQTVTFNHFIKMYTNTFDFKM